MNPKTCLRCGKILSATRDEAIIQKGIMLRRRTDTRHARPLQVYECASGDGWHVGHARRKDRR